MPAALALRLTGGAANADPGKSLGGARSLVAPGGDLFDEVSPDECRVGAVEHRAVDLVNGGNQTARQVVLWAATAFALELGESGLESGLGVKAETRAPTGVSFAAHPQAAPLGLPEVPPGKGCRLWLRRPVAPGAGRVEASAVLQWRYV